MKFTGSPSRTCWLTLFAVACCFSVETRAAAQQPTQAQTSAVRAACRSDYMAHCASVPPGGKASLECLRKNIASLSASCQTAVNAIGTGDNAATPAPVAQPAPAAASTAAPTAGVAAAPPSEAEPMSPRQELRILRVSCGADYRTFCNDVPPGGGRVVACLRENGPSLSPRCRRALLGALQR
jgi:hypothetical protein